MVSHQVVATSSERRNTYNLVIALEELLLRLHRISMTTVVIIARQIIVHFFHEVVRFKHW